ncbi:serine/threonine-protein kinase, partial [Angustibacter speluncae]
MRPLLLDRTGRGPVLDERPTLPPSRVLRPGGRPVGSRYRVHDRIGSGATGTVWRGERTDDGTPVAVKLLRTELAEDPDVVTRFVRERSTLVALDHPHLVGVLDLVAEGELLAIVMPLVEGVDLRHHLRGDADGPRLSRRAAVGLLADVADALATVHAAGVVHRDVKPENVLIGGTTARPVGMLTDFGIASATRDSRLTRSSRFVGTPVYLAPERALGRTSGAPADVYALAVTVYEVLAGHPPFAAADDLAVLRAQVDEHARRPDGWDDAVWDVVSAALAKSPAVDPGDAELGLGPSVQEVLPRR